MLRKLCLTLGFLGWLTLAGSGAADETPASGYSEPIAVWDAFLAAIRDGQMRAAYACVAPAVREKLNYRDFCVAWHPLTKNCQAVLMPPVFSEFCIAGEIAYLRLGVRQNGGADAEFMHAYLARENSGWWLVSLDPRLAAPVVTEADGRAFLRALWAGSALVRASLQQGAPATLDAIRREMPRLFTQENTRRVLANYEFEIDNLRAGVLRLRPRNSAVRCLEFSADECLTVRNETPEKNLTTDAAAERAREEEIRKHAAAVAAAKAEAVSRSAAAVSLPPSAAAGLPELPPDFGNPDAVIAGSAAPAAAMTAAAGARANEPLMPELDEPEMLLAPPANSEGAVPPTGVRLR